MFSGVISIEACLFVVSSSCAYNEVLKQWKMLPISIYKQGIQQNWNVQSIQYGKPFKFAEIVWSRRWWVKGRVQISDFRSDKITLDNNQL